MIRYHGYSVRNAVWVRLPTTLQTKPKNKNTKNDDIMQKIGKIPPKPRQTPARCWKILRDVSMYKAALAAYVRPRYPVWKMVWYLPKFSVKFKLNSKKNSGSCLFVGCSKLLVYCHPVSKPKVRYYLNDGVREPHFTQLPASLPSLPKPSKILQNSLYQLLRTLTGGFLLHTRPRTIILIVNGTYFDSLN